MDLIYKVQGQKSEAIGDRQWVIGKKPKATDFVSPFGGGKGEENSQLFPVYR